MPVQFVHEVENFIKEMQALDVDKEEEDGEEGEMDDVINQNINNADDQDDTGIDIADQC